MQSGALSGVLQVGYVARTAPCGAYQEHGDLNPMLFRKLKRFLGRESPLISFYPGGVYNFTLNDIDGNPVPLSQFRGKVLMLVNTASFCGNTPQYGDLQVIYEKYLAKGFEVLAFPANNFDNQEPGTNEEIKCFCHKEYRISFPLFGKISVRGENKHPLYHFLTKCGSFPDEVEWNFQKYLVDREENVVSRYSHSVRPLAGKIVRDIECELAKTGASDKL